MLGLDFSDLHLYLVFFSQIVLGSWPSPSHDAQKEQIDEQFLILFLSTSLIFTFFAKNLEL